MTFVVYRLVVLSEIDTFYLFSKNIWFMRENPIKLLDVVLKHLKVVSLHVKQKYACTNLNQKKLRESDVPVSSNPSAHIKVTQKKSYSKKIKGYLVFVNMR